MTTANRGINLSPSKALFYIIFTVSGFSGLIYQSIWSHYLKLFLGHAAYAQSLVLAIFMGGMALGAWLAGRYSAKWRIPILGYAIVEAVIGIFALIFHGSFVAITDAAHTMLLPGTDSIMVAHTLKWTIAALMIIPQSILLGMTFPLMTAGVIRRFRENSGGTISLLYFTNSIGAAIGVLASGFWLINAIGLPGTIMVAGIINLLLAGVVALIVKMDASAATAPLSDAPDSGITRANKLLLAAAFITGAASFIYEIGWIRMLTLVLGGSTHAFELMLSAFITGLAFGGLWIRKYIDKLDSPIRFAAYAQLAKGLLALLTLPLYSLSFDWMNHLMHALDRTPEGYDLLMFSSHTIALAIMLPATFCAGMTLPLFTHALLKTGYGEKSIGQVYAFNTFGAIAGILFAVNIGLPYFGLQNLIGFGAGMDILLGVALLYFALSASTRRFKYTGATLAIAALLGLIITSIADITPSKLSSGVFRYMRTALPENQEVYYYRDGKTASISLYGERGEVLTISTNGKPDATILYNPQTDDLSDEDTMILLGSLAFGFQPDAKNIAVIGMGSGLSTHTALALPSVEKVDTIEIEAAMVEAATEFGHRVYRAFNDPRSFIHIEDAKTFFAIHNAQYDMIISEPSNPWVSGVSSLYTREFYGQIRNYLTDNGLLVQWFHLYENDFRLLVSILKAMDTSFDDYALYFTNSLDVLIIARKTGAIGPLNTNFLLNSELKTDLLNTSLSTESDLHHRLILTKQQISGILARYDIPANSDFYPYLDQHAHKAFYIGTTITEFHMQELDFPFADILNRNHESGISRNLSENRMFFPAKHYQTANVAHRLLIHNDPSEIHKAPIELRNAIQAMQQSAGQCNQAPHDRLFQDNLHNFARLMIANLDSQRAHQFWSTGPLKTCAAIADTPLIIWLTFYEAVAARDFASMTQLARVLLVNNHYNDDDSLLMYLLSAAVIGSYMDNEPEQVISIWEQFIEAFGQPGKAPFYLQAVVFSAYQITGNP